MKPHYIHFESIDSTNSWAKRHLSSLERDRLTILCAQEQTAGYGQRGRSWISPKGEGLWASFCFQAKNVDVFLYTRHMADSLISLLAEEGITGQIKWPNDILVHQKKIAGILTEVSDDIVILGVGLNINMPEERFNEVNQPITSLFALTRKQFPVEGLLEKLAQYFKKYLY
jgi:BirA family biotin operon repressor/biotin-[acetyl-CoA-carboxylase] ligase